MIKGGWLKVRVEVNINLTDDEMADWWEVLEEKAGIYEDAQGGLLRGHEGVCEGVLDTQG